MLIPSEQFCRLTACSLVVLKNGSEAQANRLNFVRQSKSCQQIVLHAVQYSLQCKN